MSITHIQELQDIVAALKQNISDNIKDEFLLARLEKLIQKFRSMEKEMQYLLSVPQLYIIQLAIDLFQISQDCLLNNTLQLEQLTSEKFDLYTAKIRQLACELLYFFLCQESAQAESKTELNQDIIFSIMEIFIRSARLWLDSNQVSYRNYAIQCLETAERVKRDYLKFTNNQISQMEFPLQQNNILITMQVSHLDILEEQLDISLHKCQINQQEGNIQEIINKFQDSYQLILALKSNNKTCELPIRPYVADSIINIMIKLLQKNQMSLLNNMLQFFDSNFPLEEIEDYTKTSVLKIKLCYLNECQNNSEQFLDVYKQFNNQCPATQESELFKLVLELKRMQSQIANNQQGELSQENVLIFSKKFEKLIERFGLINVEDLYNFLGELIQSSKTYSIGFIVLAVHLDFYKQQNLNDLKLTQEVEDILKMYCLLVEKFFQVYQELLSQQQTQDDIHFERSLICSQQIIYFFLQFRKYSFNNANSSSVLAFQQRFSRLLLHLWRQHVNIKKNQLLTLSIEILDSLILLNNKQNGANKEIIKDLLTVGLMLTFQSNNQDIVQIYWKQYKQAQPEGILTQLFELQISLEYEQEAQQQMNGSLQEKISSLLTSIMSNNLNQNKFALEYLIKLIISQDKSFLILEIFLEFICSNFKQYLSFFADISELYQITLLQPFVTYLIEKCSNGQLENQNLNIEILKNQENLQQLLNFSNCIISICDQFIAQQQLIKESGCNNNNISILCNIQNCELLGKIFWNASIIYNQESKISGKFLLLSLYMKLIQIIYKTFDSFINKMSKKQCQFSASKDNQQETRKCGFQLLINYLCEEFVDNQQFIMDTIKQQENINILVRNSALFFWNGTIIIKQKYYNKQSDEITERDYNLFNQVYQFTIELIKLFKNSLEGLNPLMLFIDLAAFNFYLIYNRLQNCYYIIEQVIQQNELSKLILLSQEAKLHGNKEIQMATLRNYIQGCMNDSSTFNSNSLSSRIIPTSIFKELILNSFNIEEKAIYMKQLSLLVSQQNNLEEQQIEDIKCIILNYSSDLMNSNLEKRVESRVAVDELISKCNPFLQPNVIANMKKICLAI